MTIDDPLLPAAAHLSGPLAADVLRPAVERAGGELRSLTCAGVQYRPGIDLVARFRADVAWRGGAPTRETLLAATTASGPPPGTLPVGAETENGELTVGVWRWPFDPALPALETLVRTTGARELLMSAGLMAADDPIELKVRAYRPTDRVVVRIHAGDRTWYLKVLRSDRAAAIAERHTRLLDHGLPVPPIVTSDLDRGWLLLAELTGPTLREAIKADTPTWLTAETYRDLVASIASVAPDGLASTRSRLKDAPSHAELLREVLPAEGDRLGRLAERFRRELEGSAGRSSCVVHGDLHEGQIVVNDGRITGLLDIDEVGLGDPLDDVTVLMGHLRYRARNATSNASRINVLVDELITVFAEQHGRQAILLGTAAVLMGIAGAPFRSQRDGWREAVASTLDLVEHTLP